MKPAVPVLRTRHLSVLLCLSFLLAVANAQTDPLQSWE